MTLIIDDRLLVCGGILLIVAWLLAHRCPDCPLAAARPVGERVRRDEPHAAEGHERAFEPRVVDKRAGVAGVE